MFYTEGTESETEEDNSVAPKCMTAHNGRLMVDEIYPVHVDALFTMLFTNSQFFLDLQEMRKCTNIRAGSWCDDDDGTKKRVVTMTIPLTQTLGPKSSNVIETQTMLPHSEPGKFYSIDVKIENKGIPYADKVYFAVHFCMAKCSERKSSLEIYADVKYTQKVWGLVRGIIEKNSWSGMQEAYATLNAKLHSVIDENLNAVHKRKMWRRKRGSSPIKPPEEIKSASVGEKIEKLQMDVSLLTITGFLIVLLLINAYLYYKLWSLERMVDFEYVNMENSKYDILSSEKYQNYNQEIEKLLQIIATSVRYLKNAEESLRFAEATAE